MCNPQASKCNLAGLRLGRGLLYQSHLAWQSYFFTHYTTFNCVSCIRGKWIKKNPCKFLENFIKNKKWFNERPQNCGSNMVPLLLRKCPEFSNPFSQNQTSTTTSSKLEFGINYGIKITCPTIRAYIHFLQCLTSSLRKYYWLNIVIPTSLRSCFEVSQ